MHAVARALQRAGVTAWAVDMRGHGGSGRRRGDIDRIGQLDDDVADLAEALQTREQAAHLIYVGFSAGAGLGMRIAAGAPADRWFERYLLLAPPLGYGGATSRPLGDKISVASGRFFGLLLLDAIGLDAFAGLPVIAFGVPPELRDRLTASYSFRLATSFGPHMDALDDLRKASKPMAVVIGENDELLVAPQYPAVVHGVRPELPVRMVPGVGHTGLVTQPTGIEAIVAACLAQGISAK
jgi:pimeloyl-ACP methyl ester carboxylesterase